MATFNGTQGNDTYAGTVGNDLITGIAGDDTLNGAQGNDTITGGAGKDDILGGDDNDWIIIEEMADLTNDSLDGGNGTDRLITELAVGDDLTGGDGAALTGVTLWTDATVQMANIEEVEVTNAKSKVLTLGVSDVLALDETLKGANFAASGATALDSHDFDGYKLTAGGLHNTLNKLIITDSNGSTTLDIGDTYNPPSGGSIKVSTVAGKWALNYTPPNNNLGTVTVNTDTILETLDVQFTDGSGNTLNKQVHLEQTFGPNIDLFLQNTTTDTEIIGDVGANVLRDGAGDDTIRAGDGADTVILTGGNNDAWAGPGDNGNDTVDVEGQGDNTVGMGNGNDTFNVKATGTGDNTLFGGRGTDVFNVDGAGNNTIWAGKGSFVDTININGTANGNNTIGGGEGADAINILGNGDNTVYLGKDDVNDTLIVNGNGDNTLFGGAGPNGTGTNSITVNGNGVNTVFNGNGDDNVFINGSGDNILWGSKGDDDFVFGGPAAEGTLMMADGNGNDEVFGFGFGEDKYLDVTNLTDGAGNQLFNSANDVLAKMKQIGPDVELFVTAGHTITFDSMTLNQFTNATPSDWLVV